MRKFVITGLLFCLPLLATEIDSFTLRDPGMQDALQELDEIMQRNFEKALRTANQAQSCEAAVFEKAFHGTIKGPLWSLFETDIQHSQTLDRRTIARENSIYRDVRLFEGIAFYMAQLGYLMRIGEFYIGSDKFGHFLETGHDYYRFSSLEKGLEYGEMTERTYFGLTTTGVYSYGDLAANLDGYTFWKNLNQYVTCENKLWTQQNSFTWADYINAAWDEGLNCSYYKNDHITNSVQRHIAELGMTCPVESGHCTSMIEHYGYLAGRIVTKDCFESKT